MGRSASDLLMSFEADFLFKQRAREFHTDLKIANEKILELEEEIKRLKERLEEK